MNWTNKYRRNFNGDDLILPSDPSEPQVKTGTKVQALEKEIKMWKWLTIGIGAAFVGVLAWSMAK